VRNSRALHSPSTTSNPRSTLYPLLAPPSPGIDLRPPGPVVRRRCPGPRSPWLRGPAACDVCEPTLPTLGAPRGLTASGVHPMRLQFRLLCATLSLCYSKPTLTSESVRTTRSATLAINSGSSGSLADALHLRAPKDLCGCLIADIDTCWRSYPTKNLLHGVPHPHAWSRGRGISVLRWPELGYKHTTTSDGTSRAKGTPASDFQSGNCFGAVSPDSNIDTYKHSHPLQWLHHDRVRRALQIREMVPVPPGLSLRQGGLGGGGRPTLSQSDKIREAASTALRLAASARVLANQPPYDKLCTQ